MPVSEHDLDVAVRKALTNLGLDPAVFISHDADGDLSIVLIGESLEGGYVKSTLDPKEYTARLSVSYDFELTFEVPPGEAVDDVLNPLAEELRVSIDLPGSVGENGTVTYESSEVTIDDWDEA